MGRIPILFSFINIIIRSGCSFKPKIIPMFIDQKTLRPQTFYGSSYKLLEDAPSMDYIDLFHEARSQSFDDESSSEDEEDEEYENIQNFDYQFIPKQLFDDDR